MIHVWRPLWGKCWGLGKNEMLSDVGGWEISEYSRSPIFIFYLFFFVKVNWICAMTRHHAEPNINILLTKNLCFDYGVRQWSHPSMIPLPCLWAKSNNRTHGQFECDMNWFCFCFDFVCSHARCSCCSINCLRFQVVKGKKTDWKMNTKNLNNYKYNFKII